MGKRGGGFADAIQSGMLAFGHMQIIIGMTVVLIIAIIICIWGIYGGHDYIVVATILLTAVVLLVGRYIFKSKELSSVVEFV